MLQLSLEEFEQRFGMGIEKRQELCLVFQEWLSAMQTTFLLRQVWVFGSFVTNKPGPGDLDLVALFAAEIDLFTMKETTPAEVRAMILGTFGRSRESQVNIVEIAL